MNVLDENIVERQCELLRDWNVPFQQIGFGVGELGMDDDRILELLMRLRRPTFFTTDVDFNDPRKAHTRYCLVYMDIEKKEVASYVWRFLRHPSFRTQAQRLGRLVRLSSAGIVVWMAKGQRPEHFHWTTA